MLKLKTVSFCAALGSGIFVGSGLATAQQQGPPPPRRAAIGPSALRASAKAQPPYLLMKNYKVRPTDLVLVEVLEALPGRPISGERLVRPDGKISLGFYGEIPVVGLTGIEIKERIVNHLRNYLSDRTLGLVDLEPETGEPRIDPTTMKEKRIAPRDSDRVFVDVTAYNSHFYYVQGAVLVPGRFPVTGRETILDVLCFTQGLLPQADHSRVVLYRPNKDGTLRAMPVDIDQITMGDDPSTNYQLRPDDRLVVPEIPAAKYSTTSAGPQHSKRGARPPAIEPALYFERSRYDSEAAKAGHEERLRKLESQLQSIESKLDEIAASLSRPNAHPPLREPFEPEMEAGDDDTNPSRFDQPSTPTYERPEMEHHNPFQMDEPPTSTDERPATPRHDINAPPPPADEPPTEKSAQGTYEDND